MSHVVIIGKRYCCRDIDRAMNTYNIHSFTMMMMVVVVVVVMCIDVHDMMINAQHIHMCVW